MVVMDRIDHVTIVVKNMKESEDFYRKAFGLELIREWKREGLKSILLGGKEGTLLELWEYDEPETGEHYDKHKIGINHIAFQIENIEEKIKLLEKLGVKTIQDIQKGITVENFALIKDPNGITIELVELKKI